MKFHDVGEMGGTRVVVPAFEHRARIESVSV